MKRMIAPVAALTLTLMLTLALISWAGSAGAGEGPVPDDFAFGLVVEAGGDGPLYATGLSLDFYRGVTKSDLGDACLFNARGEVVPFALQLPAADSSRASTSVGLPVFPILGDADERLDGLSLKIRRDDSGAIIDVSTGDASRTGPVQAATPASERRIVAYLLDAGGVERPIEALELEWQPSAESFVGKVTVESSDDLEHWAVRVKDATIAGLRYGDHSLVQRKIRLERAEIVGGAGASGKTGAGARAGVKARYLRLAWPRSPENVTLTTVTAELREKAADLPLQWTTVHGALKEDDKEGVKGALDEGAKGGIKRGAWEGVGEGTAREIHFDAPGPLPVSRLRVRLPEASSLVSVSLHSRASAREPWHRRHAGLSYRLTVKGEDLSSPEVDLPSPVMDRFWLLRIESNGAGLGQGLPDLELGWTPHRLVFLPRGGGPFLLGFGSGQIDRRRVLADDALTRFVADNKEKMEISPARLGEKVVLGGEARLSPPVVYPWKQWILWAVLVLGVVLMAWMALRLYGQINDTSRREGE